MSGLIQPDQRPEGTDVDDMALANAQAFAEFGFGVFSVWGIDPDTSTCRCPKAAACTSPGKHPIPIDGLKSATSDPARVLTMLQAKGSLGQYGIVPAPHIIVLDVDGEGWQEKLRSLGLPRTFAVQTANGVHLYFYWPESYGPQPTRLYGWVVRSQEHPGYVIGPGSTHQSGVRYTVAHQNGHDIFTMLARIAVLPREATSRDQPTITVGQGLRQPESIAEGSRHDYLRDRARTLRGGGLTGDDLWKAMQSINARLPSPKSDEELRRAIGDVETKFGEDPLPETLSPEVQAEQLEARASSLETLASLPFGTPPEPLVQSTFVAPEGWTVMYANGGTGKGLLALWMMRHILAGLEPEQHIAVLDYEGHRWEWGNRARAIGWTQAELERVIYIDPYVPIWSKGYTLAGIAPELRPVGDEMNVAFYVVDSYVAAAGSDAEMGGVKGAMEFFKAAAALGQPGLTLAHTSAGGDQFPAKPFGSSFIHNFARETWAGAQTGSETGLSVPGVFGVTATNITVELRNKKRSVGARAGGSHLFTIEFRSDSSIRIDYQQDFERPIRDLILDVLSTTQPMTVKDISRAIEEDTGRKLSEESLRTVIRRGVDGLVEHDGRPKTYTATDFDPDES
jgi:hypothetical protein